MLTSFFITFILCRFTLNLKINRMKIRTTRIKEIIEALEQVDTDFYKGIYTTGEMYDLIKEINQVLTKY
jgi:hypothetical protein